jgi:hypothetical protein
VRRRRTEAPRWRCLTHHADTSPVATVSTDPTSWVGALDPRRSRRARRRRQALSGVRAPAPDGVKPEVAQDQALERCTCDGDRIVVGRATGLHSSLIIWLSAQQVNGVTLARPSRRPPCRRPGCRSSAHELVELVQRLLPPARRAPAHLLGVGPWVMVSRVPAAPSSPASTTSNTTRVIIGYGRPMREEAGSARRRAVLHKRERAHLPAPDLGAWARQARRGFEPPTVDAWTDDRELARASPGKLSRCAPGSNYARLARVNKTL